MRSIRTLVLATTGLIAASALTGCGTDSSTAAPNNTSSLGAAIASLPVAVESRAGYERTSFKHWVDADHDGCDTREEVLTAEATRKATTGAGCAITSGTWYSYYDDKTLTDDSALDIDHMVPLAEAWDSGASKWDADRRRSYANDLGDKRSLIAVSATSNRSKSDQDPAEWMPPNQAARCRYLTEWVATKLRWGLSVDAAERDALNRNAHGCTGEVSTQPAG